MAVDFPNSPTQGQTFTNQGAAYVYDGVKWVAKGNATGFGTGVPIWLTVGDTPPPSPTVGSIWFDSAGMQSYLRYQDPDSTEWVPLSNQGSPIGSAASLQNVGRNFVHNSKFNIAQRGTGPFNSTNTNMYTLDRWLAAATTDTLNVSQQVLADSDRAQIGDESAYYCLTAQFVGTSGAAAYTNVSHWIENVYRLSGKTVTVSFWASSSVAINVGVSIDQWFGGTGNSPYLYGTGQSVSVVPTWRRYAVTFTLPSVAGKTIDPVQNGTGVYFWLSSGTANAAHAGNIGVQATTIWFWGVQVELGSVASAFQTAIDPMLDLQQCLRFYCTNGYLYGFANTPSEVVVLWTYPVPMRITPAITLLTTTPYAECKPYVQGFTASGGTVSPSHQNNNIACDVAVDGFSGMAQDQFALLGQHQLAASADL